jgi:hypothetical protein
MRLYIAGPLFTEAERAFNVVLARALEAAGHDVYLPQRDTAPAEGPSERGASSSRTWPPSARQKPLWPSATAPRSTTAPPGRSATPTGETFRSSGSGQTDSRLGQRADEPVNLMILESLSELSSTIEQLIHTIRYTERP